MSQLGAAAAFVMLGEAALLPESGLACTVSGLFPQRQCVSCYFEKYICNYCYSPAHRQISTKEFQHFTLPREKEEQREFIEHSCSLKKRLSQPVFSLQCVGEGHRKLIWLLLSRKAEFHVWNPHLQPTSNFAQVEVVVGGRRECCLELELIFALW